MSNTTTSAADNNISSSLKIKTQSEEERASTFNLLLSN